jgi:predicted MPP superfamily phosphohydrolase
MGALTKALSRSLWGLGLAGVGAAAWGVFIERTRFQLREETVPILDPGATPIKVLHLSDLHLAPWHRSTVSWVRELATLAPDLIIGTGDFFGHKDALPTIADALQPFAGVPGVVVHGSNDFIGPRPINPLKYLWEESGGTMSGDRVDFDGLHRLYTDTLGWHDIDNTAITLVIADQVLELIGVGDAHIGRDNLSALTTSIEQGRESSPVRHDVERPATTTIGVTHAPYRKVLNSLVNHGAELILAGHTHGGQVQVPGLGALTTNCDLPTRYARGFHTWSHASRSSYLNVSAGLGTSIYAPVRFWCPPEAILLTLTGDDFGYA